MVSYYQKALNSAPIDKSHITIYDAEGKAIHVCTPELAGLAVSRHSECLATLQKMQDGKKITPIEHESLLEVPFFQRQREITHYAHVEKPLKRKHS